MDFEMREKVVVITGASSGIGRATAEALSQRNATVVLAARNGEELRDVAKRCESLGGRPLVVPTDVSLPESVEELAKAKYAA